MKTIVSQSVICRVFISMVAAFAIFMRNVKNALSNCFFAIALSKMGKTLSRIWDILKIRWETSAIDRGFSKFENVYENNFVVVKYNKDYKPKDIYSESDFIRLFQKLLSLINKLVISAHRLDKVFSHSLINAFSHSLIKVIGKALMEIKFVEELCNLSRKIFSRITFIYILMLYPFIDYLLREIMGSSLANIWDEALMFLTLVALFCSVIKKGKVSFRFSKLYLPFFLYIFYCIAILIMNSPDMGIAIEGLRVDIEYILWFFILVNLIRNKDEIRNVLRVFVIVNIFVALYGIYQYIAHVPVPRSWYSAAESYVTTRAFSVVGSCNILGSLNMVTVLIAVSLINGEKKLLMKFVYFFAIISNLICLVFTMSRGAWIAFMFAAFIYASLLNRKLFILFIAGAAAGIAAMPSIAMRMVYIFSSDYASRSADGGRIERWGKAIEMANEHPIIGQGLGRYGGAVARNHWISNTTDNFYLKVLAELGYGGLFVFFILIVCIIYEGFAIIRVVRDVPELKYISIGIYSSLIGVIVHNCVENIFEGAMMMTFFMSILGLLVAMKYLVKPSVKADEIIVFDK